MLTVREGDMSVRVDTGKTLGLIFEAEVNISVLCLREENMIDLAVRQ